MNTRVAVPLSQEAYDAVSFLAKVGGSSRGKVLSDAISAAVPSILRMADAYRAALEVEGQERQQIIESFEKAERHLLDALTGNVLMLSELVSGGEGARAQARVSALPDPPATNRGVPVSGDGGSDAV